MSTRREAALNGWRRSSRIVEQRACADCERYAALSTMTTKADGRVICAGCQSKLERLAAEKAQPSLFVEQVGLFT